MKIQSLSVVVPTKGCVNNCPFCVSKLHDNDYCNNMSDELFVRDYLERLEYCRDNNVNTVVLTGTGEALQNKKFLENFAKWNNKLYKKFYNIELQTTGVFLDDKTIKWLRKDIGVKTISLSVSDIFNDDNNCDIINVPKKYRFKLNDICNLIKENNLNLRISLNMLKNLSDDTESGGSFDVVKIFKRLTELGVDQVTFRKMWLSGNDDSNEWLRNNEVKPKFVDELNTYIENGTLIGTLPYGSKQYSSHDISIVLDKDCMSDNNESDTIRYAILRENGKLYSKWDLPSSLLF